MCTLICWLLQETQGQGSQILRAHYTTDTQRCFCTPHWGSRVLRPFDLLAPWRSFLHSYPLLDTKKCAVPALERQPWLLLWGSPPHLEVLSLAPSSGPSLGSMNSFQGLSVPNVLAPAPSGSEGLFLTSGREDPHPIGRGSFRSFLFGLGLSLENQKLGIWLKFSVVCGVIFFLTQPMLLVQWEICERLQGNLEENNPEDLKDITYPIYMESGPIWQEWN